MPDLRGERRSSPGVVRGILSGEKGPARDIVLANCAAALFAAEQTDDLRAGVATSAAVLDDGTAAALLEQFAELTRTIGGN